MFIDLNTTEGEKFTFFNSTVDPNTGDIVYDEPEEGGPWAVFRNPQPFWEERAKSRKKRFENVYNPKTRAMNRVEYEVELTKAQEEKEMADFWDYVLIDFGGFKDKKTKKPIECNMETKVAFSKVPLFRRFAQRCFAMIEEGMVTRVEEEEKNS